MKKHNKSTTNHHMDKQPNKIFEHKLNIEILPSEPLIGIKFINCHILHKDNIDRPLFRVEIGILFLTLSYTNIDYSDLD